jgi:hypothetical protein
MEQSPSSETDRFSPSQEIPRILWPQVTLPLLQEPPPVPTLNQINPVFVPHLTS